MTDAEKELREDALDVQKGFRKYPPDDMWPLSDHCAQKTATTVLALLDRIEALENFAEGFAGTADAAIAHAENPGTGMQVPFHGDFAQAKGSPSLLRNLRWWARAAREVLAKP